MLKTDLINRLSGKPPFQSLRTLSLVISPLLLAACASYNAAPTARLSAAKASGLQQCAALGSSFKFDNTVIDSASPQAKGAMSLAGQPIDSHCLVKGRMFARKGSDGRDYAIGFEMRLPDRWNGRFFYQGNGGLDGAVRPAEGALGGGPITGALMQGFAVISSDAGHNGPQTPFFGAEPQARLDYGYQAVAKLTPMAKALVTAGYARAPDRSYIGGCSNGGRHTMVEAARGQAYDGYLVGAPGYRLPLAATAQLWGAQQWASLATPGAMTKHPMNPQAMIPDLETALTAQERQVVAQAILKQCDALDGAADGMVQATQACQAKFDLARDVPTCQGERNGQCLTVAQKQVLSKVHAGARTSKGETVYAPFVFDTGIAAPDWAQWKFKNSIALDPLAVGSVFSVPPSRVDPLKVNIDQQFPLIHATSAVYQESGMSLMTPPDHADPKNLAPLAQRGAKMVLYHGVSDAIFSAEDTRQWMLRLNQSLGGRADQFARYFPVPGMNHCRGGPSTDQFDLLNALVQWVEYGQAPQAVVASARGAGNAGGINMDLPVNWSAQRTRPLCAYPSVATYKGSGSLESASSFVCQ